MIDLTVWNSHDGKYGKLHYLKVDLDKVMGETNFGKALLTGRIKDKSFVSVLHKESCSQLEEKNCCSYSVALTFTDEILVN